MNYNGVPKTTSGAKVKNTKENKAKKYVRLNEGAAMYSMGLSKFRQLVKEANATYKIGKMCLVNTEIFERYLETFREF